MVTLVVSTKCLLGGVKGLNQEWSSVVLSDRFLSMQIQQAVQPAVVVMKVLFLEFVSAVD